MKVFTNIEQSKKLAEFLPLESADMAWCNNSIKGINYTDKFSANLYTVKEMKDVFDEALVGWDKYWELVPCWSLTALLDVLPDSIYDNTYEFSQLEFTKKSVAYIHGTTDGIKIGALKDNLVDACVEMIIKLHEQKLL